MTAGIVIASGHACPVGKYAAAAYQTWATCAASPLKDRGNFEISPGLGSRTSMLELGNLGYFTARSAV